MALVFVLDVSRIARIWSLHLKDWRRPPAVDVGALARGCIHVEKCNGSKHYDWHLRCDPETLDPARSREQSLIAWNVAAAFDDIRSLFSPHNVY